MEPVGWAVSMAAGPRICKTHLIQAKTRCGMISVPIGHEISHFDFFEYVVPSCNEKGCHTH